jgi:hypothetical protein
MRVRWLLLNGLGLSVALLLTGACAWPGPVRWELPDGFRGEVLFTYERRDCPPLSWQGLTLVIPIDAAGCGCTSNSLLGAARAADYVYVQPDGGRVALDHASWIHERGVGIYLTLPNGPSFKTRRFFVGTPDEAPPAAEDPQADTPDPDLPTRRCGIPTA